MKKLILFFFIFLIGSVSAEDYKVFDDITSDNLDYNSVDTFANCEIVSYRYSEINGTSILAFEIHNSHNDTIVASVWDVYAKKKHKINIEPGTHIYEFKNIKLKYGKFFFAFIKGDEFALVKESVQVITLPDEVYLASKDAINWFSFKKSIFCLGLFLIGLLFTKEYLVRKLLYYRIKEAKLFVLSYIILYSILLLWYVYGGDYSTWDVRYLVSYYNWIYYLFIVLGFIVGFRLFKPDLKRLLLFDFPNWNIKLVRIPCVNEQDFLRVRWSDGNYYVMSDDRKFNEFGFYDTLFDDDGKIQIVTKYDIFRDEIRTDYEGFWKSLLAKLDKLIKFIKCKFGAVIGAVSIDRSCIMSKDIAECIFLSDSLEKLNYKLYELYYKIVELKNVRGVEIVSVSQTAMDIILRDEAPEFSDITFESIKDMSDDEDKYKKESMGEDDGTGGIGNEEVSGNDGES